MSDLEPITRREVFLNAIAEGGGEVPEPVTREEVYLKAILDNGGGGGGGTTNYNNLNNKPSINDVELSGNKTTEDLIPIDKGLEFDSDGKLAVSLGNGLAFNSDGEINNLTEANPSDSATGELSKLKVGSDIYSVVTKAVNDLTNYYTKSDVYTKTEVNNIAQARFAVVAQLPTEDIQTNVIYLVPKSTEQTNNDYDEYIYALKSTNHDTYGWEKIGDTEIDLSDYVTTQALNTALADYTTTTDLTTLLAGKQNALTFDSTPIAQSTNPVTSGGIKSYVDGQGAKTVSGNPITITDAEAMNADHVVATITPTQDLHGYNKPWAGGTGKNKFPLTVANIKSANSGATWTGNATTINGVTFTILTDADGNVTGINAKGTASANAILYLCGIFENGFSGYLLNGSIGAQYEWAPVGIAYFDSSDTYITEQKQFRNEDLEILSHPKYTLYVMIASGHQNVDYTFFPMIRLATETDASFAPYSNECPISGLTEANAVTVGKNLFNKNSQQIINGKRLSTSTGGTYSDGNYSVSHYIEVEPNEYYTLFRGGEASYSSYFCIYSDDSKSAFRQGGSWTNYQSIQMPSNAKYIRFDFPTAQIDVVQFEKGQQATAYEPYTANNVTITFGETVYGGNVDFDSGIVTVKWVSGSITWFNRSNARQYWVRANPRAKVSTGNVYCDKLPKRNDADYGVSVDNMSALVFLFPDEYESAEDAINAYGGSLQVVYELETYTELTLTPAQLTLLKEYNTITTNASNLDVTYQTNSSIGDTASALDKRVTSLESKVPQPPTTDGTYKLTVTVASGEPTYSWESAT